MAFTLHWANTYAERYPPNTKKHRRRVVGDNHNNRTCPLTSGLSLQSDVLYPNAAASLSALASGETFAAPGCVGNQLDSPFPLESRTPLALPLVMYPGTRYGEQDICSLPVLNWEKYIKSIHGSATQGAPSEYFFSK